MAFKLVDMAETPKNMGVLAGIEPGQRPYYPSMSLNEENLSKLGVSEKPEIGEVFHIMVLAKVSNVSENASEDMSSCRVGFDLIQMGMENESKEYSYKEKLYDHGDDDEGE